MLAPLKYFTDRSKAVLLLWIFYVLFWLVFAMFLCASVYMCFVVICWEGWPLDSRLWCLTVSLSLSQWYPGSGVVLDCIDSWSLHPYLLCSRTTKQRRQLGSNPGPSVSSQALYYWATALPRRWIDYRSTFVNFVNQIPNLTVCYSQVQQNRAFWLQPTHTDHAFRCIGFLACLIQTHKTIIK